MKKYVLISGLFLNANNRGTAALGYGSFTFLINNGFIHEGQEFLEIRYVRYPWKYKDSRKIISIQGKDYYHNTVYVFSLFSRLQRENNIVPPLTKISRLKKDISIVAAINGGDGFSDIYGTESFYSRLPEIKLAMSYGIPVILLPQTIGPFEEEKNYNLARKILKYSSSVYVRDEKFIKELDKMGVKYILSKDLSAFMLPQQWNINIEPGSIGLNVSGLAYSNTYRKLSGQFDYYPELIQGVIDYFQNKGKKIYLIPHSYNYYVPEESNDDMVACREVYENLRNKRNVVLIDKDLSSPQIKYVISKMSFFCGTRMHANFAAIYSNVPVFGFAYSYKFEGAFNYNGQDGKRQTAMINNIKHNDVEYILKKLIIYYEECCNSSTMHK